MTFLGLLRGINVGGKARLPMKILVGIFEESGATDVRTYIQSGNVIFEAAGEAEAAEIIAWVTTEINGRYGYPGHVVIRSAEQMQAVLSGNPFVQAGVDPETLHLYFLADLPDQADVARLDPQRSGADRFVVLGREIYLHLPNGMARTRLTNAFFDTHLKTLSTARNWRTVGILAGMMRP